LRLAIVWVPAGAGDPAPHHVGAARHQIGVMFGVRMDDL
jgi:hypothetical protein